MDLSVRLWKHVHRGSVHLVERGTTPGHPGVIVKRFRDAYPSPRDVARLLREHEILRELAHVPGVVRTRGVARLDGLPALLLEDCGDLSLRRRLADGPLPVDEALRLSEGIAQILTALHDAGFVHRDINPSNIVLRDGAPCLLDFGLALRRQEWATSSTSAGDSAGTAAYLAPEQTGMTGMTVDERSDLYALGATMYEMLCGAPPFRGATRDEVVRGHLARRPEPPPGVPDPVVELILTLLEKNPAARYQTAAGLRRDLGALICRVTRRRAAGVCAVGPGACRSWGAGTRAV